MKKATSSLPNSIWTGFLANLDADRLIKKDFIYYARILARKNQNYYKMLIDADNDAGELSKLQARSATSRRSCKGKKLC